MLLGRGIPVRTLHVPDFVAWVLTSPDPGSTRPSLPGHFTVLECRGMAHCAASALDARNLARVLMKLLPPDPAQGELTCSLPGDTACWRCCCCTDVGTGCFGKPVCMRAICCAPVKDGNVNAGNKRGLPPNLLHRRPAAVTSVPDAQGAFPGDVRAQQQPRTPEAGQLNTVILGSRDGAAATLQSSGQEAARGKRRDMVARRAWHHILGRPGSRPKEGPSRPWLAEAGWPSHARLQWRVESRRRTVCTRIGLHAGGRRAFLVAGSVRSGAVFGQSRMRGRQRQSEADDSTPASRLRICWN